ncbi:MAG TPA: hypothetical protein VG146_08890 [Verrucomicrobiae bacterium]|nr:hypothetical protein [Verrucomicrobiae bacterium]
MTRNSLGGRLSFVRVSQLPGVLFLVASVVVPCGFSQTPDSFNPGVTGSMGVVYSVAVQPDGKVLVGGNFTSMAGAATVLPWPGWAGWSTGRDLQSF